MRFESELALTKLIFIVCLPKLTGLVNCYGWRLRDQDRIPTQDNKCHFSDLFEVIVLVETTRNEQS